ncbi:hypothetical protein RVR_10595 [Actinacidiphila reveromycinica]|uniref:Uncharacterized protein n=1 Tax=Actinacidiphila reveromycinica TaxID=659352 RepID=A0A7U3VRE5_9ACTN|nr:hypothetical protein [Streptomyces sp. SN-593]BBB00596.1 hypothetical protein RVR_7731 [Streptomyces sp. SN-593]BBB00649.1 hypothetical protein RVR_10595 [Streptomyces sp. SN-593]
MSTPSPDDTDPGLDYRDDPAMDDVEPCGESMCHCHHLPEHGPCGCDCPRSYGNPDDEDGESW